MERNYFKTQLKHKDSNVLVFKQLFIFKRKISSALFGILFSMMGLSIPAQNIHRTACKGNLARLDSMLTTTPIQVKDHRGRSLLHWAAACKQKEIFDFLIAKGADVNAEDNQGKIPMHIAIHFGSSQLFDKLLELQPNSDWSSKYGNSLLEKAVLQKDSLFISKLVNNGVDINSTNERGSSALEISERLSATKISKFLLALGADDTLVRNFEMKGNYMGERDPGITPKLFAPNFISTEEQEFGSVFNAEGTIFYFGVDVGSRNEIRYSERIGDIWSKPKVLLSHERYGYNDPFLSNDEHRLYFISRQALDGMGPVKDVDIWYVQKEEKGWSKPINAGSNINTSGNEYYISFTNDGTLYFSSNGHGKNNDENPDHDIYYSKNVNGEFQKPVALGDAINTKGYEGDVFIAPDESYIIFCSTREGGYGGGDLYISFKNNDGSWTRAINMGKRINTKHYEYCPVVTKDGNYLFYTSNQDIYWVNMQLISELRKKDN